MKTPLLLALLAVILFIVLWQVWPVDLSGELKERGEKELILTKKLDSLNEALNFVSKAHENLTAKYTERGDSVKQLQEKAGKTRIIYREAREATETDSTAENVAAELRAARVLIDDQESHINGLLALNSAADSLLSVRLEIISNQSEQIQVLSERLSNTVEMMNAKVDQEHKKGNRKFWRGFGFGFAARQALEFIP